MSKKQYCIVSGALFSLVASAHLLRVVFGISVQVNEYTVPMFVSWIGLTVTGTLAFWAFQVRDGKS
jgi:hypothetical protein